ncbi:MAG: hypothetical protein JWO34_1148, partial [Arthrobacter sp.]|nr:hypothetical protein [Arthrobacter sp.]
MLTDADNREIPTFSGSAVTARKWPIADLLRTLCGLSADLT